MTKSNIFSFSNIKNFNIFNIFLLEIM